ncbi:hypothetical protein [Embleya sp. NPDC020630]|uniref:hypothetical protein n=1 Tax=Embleya sp. NPDC020630 TaxID=3363979 RepID=UPI0037A5FBB2
MYTSRMAVIAMAVVLCCATLAGCAGVGDALESNVDRDARDLVRESASLVRGADDIRIIGDQVLTSTRRVDFDLCVREGRDYRGTFEINGRPGEAIVVGGKSYLKAGAEFWEWAGTSLPDTAANRRKYADRYAMLAYDPTNPLDTVGVVFAPGADGYTKGEPVTIDGRTLIPLTRVDGEGDAQGRRRSRTVYVRAYGKPYPVVIRSEGTRPQNARITRSERSCVPAAPPAGEVVDRLPAGK